MELSRVAMLFFALAILGQSDARSVIVQAPIVPAKVAAVAKTKTASLISPKLEDVASDKKFFGPPFPADYPEDKRPVAQKSILDKLKGPGQPYPALQSKADFDSDYVKDENSDTGAWKAQFEYDALRRKLAKEEADERAAEDRANKEGRDVDDAQRKADEAGKNAGDAQKGLDDAGKTGDDSGKGDDAGLPPSAESLEKLKKQVAEAEANFEKEQKDFEECKRQLEEAKARIEDLKAQQADMEQKMASDTKLWAETKTVRLNLHKAKEEAASTKRSAAEAKLKVAQNAKADVDAALAKEKAEHEVAQKAMHKKQAELKKFHQDLDAATVRLQKLRGYTPADKAGVKSGAAANAALALLACVATHIVL